MRKCSHHSAVVLHTWKKLGLTYLLCTWGCQQPYWMATEGITSREITATRAIEILEADERARAKGEAAASE